MGVQGPAVEVLGAVSVRHGEVVIAAHSLGGRRARVALVALALAERPIPAERLATMVWTDDPPPTWPVALRGVVSGLRGAVAGAGLGGQSLIRTTPSGYALADGVSVDVRAGLDAVRRAEQLLVEERFAAALAEAGTATQLDGAELLPGEDVSWLGPHREALDQARLRALELVVDAASRLGDGYRAVRAAREAVRLAPLDERAHRALIRALVAAGDRPGAVAAYEQCRALLADQFGIDPSPDTAALYLSALGQEAESRAPGRVPRPRSSFVGRDDDVAALVSALGASRLVCVEGVGGVGKTRLAQHAVSRLGPDGGRLWVPLGGLSDDELVASFAAITLGAQLGADDPTEAITALLAPRGHTLLVLDGAEPVLDGVTSLAADLLGSCPTVTILVTSRRRLGLPEERVVPLMPLPEPTAVVGPPALLASAAVRLLLDRVRDGGGSLVVDEPTATLVRQLCARCAGLPLALELAAAQLCLMPVGDLLDQLAEQADDDGLRSILRSAHDMLTPEEAAVFRRLAVLDGSVTLSLVKQVVAGEDVPAARVVRVLRELSARGLVRADTTGPRARYSVDDDVHQFARGRLEDSGELAMTFARLTDAIRSLLPDDARAAPKAFEQSITDVRESLRSLLTAAVHGEAARDDGLEIAFRLHRYWAATNVAEGHFWLSRLLAGGSESPWAALATYAAGYLSYWSGAAAAVEELQSAVALLDGVDDSYRARALIFLGGLADDLDRGEDAIGFVRQAIETAAPFDVDLRVSAAMGMACVLAERADPAAARYAAEAMSLCRASASPDQLAAALPTAAMACWQVGDLAAAREYVAAARPLHSGERRIARVVMLSAATGIALADGDIDAAVDFGRTADQEATELGVEREVPLIRSLLAHALLAVGDHSGAARAAADALAAARSLSFDFPLAVCLEAAAVVAHAEGVDDVHRRRQLGLLVSAAGGLRTRGRRPCPPTLRAAIARVAADVTGPDVGPVVDRATLDAAADTALAALAGVADLRAV